MKNKILDQINWLENYLQAWYAVDSCVTTLSKESYYILLESLCDKLMMFCKQENLVHRCAEEILEDLKEIIKSDVYV